MYVFCFNPLLKGHCIYKGYRDGLLCADILYKDSGMNVYQDSGDS